MLQNRGANENRLPGFVSLIRISATIKRKDQTPQGSEVSMIAECECIVENCVCVTKLWDHTE